MTPEELIEFGEKIGYTINITVNREDMDITAFGDTSKVYLPMLTYTVEISRPLSVISGITKMSSHDWDDMQRRLMKEMVL